VERDLNGKKKGVKKKGDEVSKIQKEEVRKP